MWTCPKCGGNSCNETSRTLAEPIQLLVSRWQARTRGRTLWHFVAEYEKVGPIKLHPVKTRVALMVDVRFAAINRVGKDFIDGHLWLKESIDSPTFYKIEHLGKSDFIHRFRIRDESDIDDEFRSL